MYSSSVYKHLETNSILCDSQHEEFLMQDSSLTTIHDIATCLNSGDQGDILFLWTLQRPLTKCPMSETGYYGISGACLECD